MRTKNRLIPQETKYYRPEITHCPHCHEKLEYCHTVSRKVISTLGGVYRIVNMGYRCSNNHCQDHTVYRSAEAEQLSLKFSTYGTDVIAYAGYLRFKEHRTRKEIMNGLNDRGVTISERQTQRLYECYAVLLRAGIDSHAKEVLQETTDKHGGIILSIDGVQPEKGNESLYVIREVLSGTVLAAKNLKSSASQELMDFVKPVLDLNFPVLGFISDGQQSIRLALEKLSPETPYQYCQIHYLKDIAKPVVERDRKLKTSVKKKLRGIRDVERKAAKNPSLESEVALDYVAAIRSVLLEDGKPPFDLPGIKVYERTKEIRDSLKKCLDKKGDSST